MFGLRNELAYRLFILHFFILFVEWNEWVNASSLYSYQANLRNEVIPVNLRNELIIFHGI